MKKQLQGLLFILLVAGLLLGLTTQVTFAAGEVFEGSKVYINDSNVYLSADPHTLGSSGWVEFEFISKNYAGALDLAWGFADLEGVKATQPQLWTSNVPYQVTQPVEKYGSIEICNIISQIPLVLGSAEPDYGNTNNTLLYRVVGDFSCLGNQTEAVVAFETYTGNLAHMTVSGYYDTTEIVTEYQDAWVDWDYDFHSTFFTYQEIDKWYYITGVSVIPGQLYKARCWVDVPFEPTGSEGEYYFAVKPSNESLWEAHLNDHLYILDPWYNASWDYRMELSINSSLIDATLTDFPLLVVLDSGNFNFTNANSTGQDIRFTEDDGETLLYYERELHNATAEEAYYWVKIPSVASDANTTFFMYYGNAAASDGADKENVWDSDFEMVHHMIGGNYTDVDDSTSNDHDVFARAGTIGYNTTGQIGLATDFEEGGTDSYFGLSDEAGLDASEGINITIEAWVKPESNPSSAHIISKRDGSGANYGLNTATGKVQFYFYNGEYRVFLTDDTIGTGTWSHLTSTFNSVSNAVEIFINGTSSKSGSIAYNLITNNVVPAIGAIYSSSEGFDGVIDELRVSFSTTAVRSDAYIKANYYSGADGLITYGAEGVPATTPTVVTSNATDVNVTTAVLWGNATSINATNITIRGFEYDTNSGTPYSSNVSEAGTFGIGVYSTNHTFAPNTTYYFRAFVVNNLDQPGYGEEFNFTTLVPLPLAPTNLTLEFSNATSIDLTWTMGLNATSTLIIGNLGSYPTNYTDGWIVYNSTGVTANESVGDTTFGGVFYRAWSINPTGFSLDSASTTTGGETMLLLAFLGIACFFTWFSNKRKDILLSIVAGLLWFSTAMWLFFSGSAPFDLSESYVQLLVWVFVIMSFVPFVFQMTTEVRKEGKRGTYTSFVKRGMENGVPETEYERHRRLLQKKTRPKRRK